MAAAFLALHRSTGDRKWLTAAIATSDFIRPDLRRPRTGGFFASASPDGPHLPKPIKQREDNVTTTRCSPCSRPTRAIRAIARSPRPAWGYLASPAVLDAYAFLPDVLLAEEELRKRAGACDDRRAEGDDPRSAASMRRRLPIPSLQARRVGGKARRAARPP